MLLIVPYTATNCVCLSFGAEQRVLSHLLEGFFDRK